MKTLILSFVTICLISSVFYVIYQQSPAFRMLLVHIWYADRWGGPELSAAEEKDLLEDPRVIEIGKLLDKMDKNSPNTKSLDRH